MKRNQEDNLPEEPDEELLSEFEWANNHISDGAVPQSAPPHFCYLPLFYRRNRHK